MRLEELGLSEWADALPNEGFEVFHTSEALRVLDEHGAGELRLLGGYKGQQLVGLLPLFVRERFGVRLVLSPPLGFGIQRLGPVVMPTSPKQRKREKVNRTFTEKAIEAVDAANPRTLFRMSCDTEYDDPRPYRWNGFNVDPGFTYRLDLASTTPDEVLKSFSKSLRREIQDGEETDIMIRTQGRVGLRHIYKTIQDRYDEQDMNVPLSWEFMRDLVETLGERARVYVAESGDGEFLSGIVALYSNDMAYFWKGGARSTHQDLSVNSLLHWRIIKDVITDPPRASIDQYDLHSANNDRIVQYKSKFGGELVPYYRIESRGLPMTATKKAYRMIALSNSLLERQSLLRFR